MLAKVRMGLLGEDGNAFAIMGRFRRAAKAQGWPKDEIDRVLDVAKAGDYNHLLGVIMDHTEDENDEGDDE